MLSGLDSSRGDGISGGYPTSWVLSTARRGMRISGMGHLACSFSSFSPSASPLLAGERGVYLGRTRCHARSTWMRDHVCFELVDDGSDHSCFSLIHGLWDGVSSTKSTFMVWHVALSPPRRSGLWSPVWLRPRRKATTRSSVFHPFWWCFLFDDVSHELSSAPATIGSSCLFPVGVVWFRSMVSSRTLPIFFCRG